MDSIIIKTENLEEDVVVKRLKVIQLAEDLGSVSEACRRSGMDRTSFYEWKRRYKKHGIKGLQDLPPVHKSHPQTTPKEVQEQIIEISLENPTWGCVRISELLKKSGIRVSSPTVQKILIRNGMAKIKDRVLKLQEEAMKGKRLSEKQICTIEKINTCFKERNHLMERPGQLLIQDTISLGEIEGLGQVYAQTVIDPFSSFVFSVLHTKKNSKDAVSIFHQKVLPFYKAKSITVKKVITDSGSEFTGKQNHPFEMYLGLHDIEHQKNVKTLSKNGFVSNFKNAVKEEFLKNSYHADSIEQLQEEFSQWVERFNQEREHSGFPTMGKTPKDVMDSYQLLSVG